MQQEKIEMGQNSIPDNDDTHHIRESFLFPLLCSTGN